MINADIARELAPLTRRGFGPTVRAVLKLRVGRTQGGECPICLIAKRDGSMNPVRDVQFVVTSTACGYPVKIRMCDHHTARSLKGVIAEEMFPKRW